jgi:hypothetical protein
MLPKVLKKKLPARSGEVRTVHPFSSVIRGSVHPVATTGFKLDPKHPKGSACCEVRTERVGPNTRSMDLERIGIGGSQEAGHPNDDGGPWAVSGVHASDNHEREL